MGDSPMMYCTEEQSQVHSYLGLKLEGGWNGYFDFLRTLQTLIKAASSVKFRSGCGIQRGLSLPSRQRRGSKINIHSCHLPNTHPLTPGKELLQKCGRMYMCALMTLTSDLDGMLKLGRFVGGDLAGVIASITLLGEGDDQVIAIFSRFHSDSARFVDNLLGHGHDLVATFPQEHESLCWKRKLKNTTLGCQWRKPIKVRF